MSILNIKREEDIGEIILEVEVENGMENKDLNRRKERKKRRRNEEKNKERERVRWENEEILKLRNGRRKELGKVGGRKNGEDRGKGEKMIRKGEIIEERIERIKRRLRKIESFNNYENYWRVINYMYFM